MPKKAPGKSYREGLSLTKLFKMFPDDETAERWFIASVVTSKPANGGHRKSGQWGWPGTVLFYPFEPVPGKPVLVRQLRGPHLRT